MSKRLEIDNEEYRKLFAERLRMARMIREANRSEVARVMQTSGMNWKRYEEGSRDIPLIALVTFAEKYNVCVKWLLLGDLSGLDGETGAALLEAFPRQISRYLPEPVQSPARLPSAVRRVSAAPAAAVARPRAQRGASPCADFALMQSPASKAHPEQAAGAGVIGGAGSAGTNPLRDCGASNIPVTE